MAGNLNFTTLYTVWTCRAELTKMMLPIYYMIDVSLKSEGVPVSNKYHIKTWRCTLKREERGRVMSSRRVALETRRPYLKTRYLTTFKRTRRSNQGSLRVGTVVFPIMRAVISSCDAAWTWRGVLRCTNEGNPCRKIVLHDGSNRKAGFPKIQTQDKMLVGGKGKNWWASGGWKGRLAGALDVFGVGNYWCAGPENLSYRHNQLSLAPFCLDRFLPKQADWSPGSVSKLATVVHWLTPLSSSFNALSISSSFARDLPIWVDSCYHLLTIYRGLSLKKQMPHFSGNTH